MSKINNATLEAKMGVRTSQVFSMKYRPGERPRVDETINNALYLAALGRGHWTDDFRGPDGLRRPAVG